MSELNAYSVINEQGAHITTVYATGVDGARIEARRVLGRPGRYDALRQWEKGAEIVVDKATGIAHSLVTFSTEKFEQSRGCPPADDIEGMVTLKVDMTKDNDGRPIPHTTTMFVANLEDLQKKGIAWGTSFKRYYRVPGPITVWLLP